MAEIGVLWKTKEKSEEFQLRMFRNIEFAIYNTTFAGANGERPFKKIRKPEDLYKLPSDIKKTNEFNGTFRADLAEAARQGKYKL